MANDKFKAFIDEIKYRLEDYARAEGLELRGNGSMRCPNHRAHRNGDSNFSANIREGNMSGYPSWACFKCSTHGDTIDMACFIHDLEKDGAGFMYDTLPFIAEKLGMKYDPKDFTDDGQDIPLPAKLSSQVKQYVKANPLPIEALTGDQYGRNYSPEFAAKILDAYPLGIVKEGAPTREQNLIMASGRIDSIIIPLIEKGIVTGAVFRHKIPQTPKYQNSEKDPAQGITYQQFINLTAGLREASESGMLYVFEGVFNTLGAIAIGLKNTIGILGVSNVKSLANVVLGHGIHEVVIVLDKDEAGQENTLIGAQSLMSAGVKVSIYTPASSEFDYDMDFNRDMEGMKKHLEDPANRLDIIEFKLRYKLDFLRDATQSDTTKFERILGEISAYGSEIMVENYAREIAAFFEGRNIYAGDLVDRIKQVLSDKTSPLLNKINSMVNERSKKFEKAMSVEEKKAILNEMSSSVNNMVEQGSLPISVVASRKLGMFLSPDAQDNLQIPTGLPNIDTPKKSNVEPLILTDSLLVGIAAKASHGKSTIVRQMAMHWAFNVPDAVAIYYSLDDAAKDTIFWMLAGLSGVAFNNIALNYRDYAQQIDKAKEMLLTIYGKKLFVLDKSDGVGDINNIIQCTRNIMREHKGKHAAIVIDNFYNINNIARAGGDSKRGQVETCIDILKEEATARSSLVVNTLEVIKNQHGRISQNDIKESGAIDYRNNITLTLYNSYKDKNEDSRMTYTDSKGLIHPVLELHSCKVKRGSIHHDYLFKLNGPTGVLEPIYEPSDVDEWMARLNADKTTLRTSQQQDGLGGSAGTGGRGNWTAGGGAGSLL